MQIGDTILQQALIPPTRRFSQKIIFGVRINKNIDETDRKGFSYETIEGHVEKGESAFTVEQTAQGLIFKIQTFSEPGNLLTKLFLLCHIKLIVRGEPWRMYSIRFHKAHMRKSLLSSFVTTVFLFGVQPSYCQDTLYLDAKWNPSSRGIGNILSDRQKRKRIMG